MMDYTIQRITPEIEPCIQLGHRRCDYLMQKRLEREVDKHDEVLRKRYQE